MTYRPLIFPLVMVQLVLPGTAGWLNVSPLTDPGRDEEIEFLLEEDDATGRLAWSVRHAGRIVVHRGALGLEFEGIGVVGDRGKVGGCRMRSFDDARRVPFGERAVIPGRYREWTFDIVPSIDGAGRPDLSLRLQVRSYPEGVALRYLVGGDFRSTVISEKTSFPLPGNTQLWVSNSAQGQIGKIMIESAGRDLERPLTAELAPDLFAALGEAGLRDHARMKLSRTGKSTLVASLAGPSRHKAPFATPWRYVRVASSPAGLLQGNHFMLSLNDDPEIADTSWIRPGKVLREVTLTTRGGIACVDWAAQHGLDFVLFDAGWYGHEYDDKSDATTVTVDPKRSPGPLDLPAVIAHARARGIGVILYVNRRALERQFDELPPLYQKWGVAGIKFGFVNVGAQGWTRWLHESIAACARHRLMVNVHDEYRMTGVEATLPNFMTAEGIRGDETSSTNEQVLRTIFTRCLAGAADQTNCYFDKRIDKMGSHASQLAKTVLIYSPWQHLFWYDRPAGSPGAGGAGGGAPVLLEVPELTFFERLPTCWDDTRWLGGHPETHAVVARRRGGVWFVGALNGAAARGFRVPLDFLEPGREYRLEVFSDDPSLDTPTRVRIDHSTVRCSDAIQRKVAARNGFAAILTPLGE